ncbi:MAG: hypothetical protein NWR30_00040 [Salibacteraceae bacterium]|nr:hypothetical protein [Salibacteraceae bacterium]
MFQGRNLIVATKHQKESVIAPLLETALGVQCLTNPAFDTDKLGTFTGEIERVLDPIQTARQKCLMAMELSQCDLGVASEGSFGPHPSMFFVSADDEFLMFIDKKNNLEIIVREISTETNFNGKEVLNWQELLAFANSAKFPSHGLILRKSKHENEGIVKGITDENTLKEVYSALYEKYGCVYVETDMRAMFNPTRMKVIAAAARKLVAKIETVCPCCGMPGFGVTDAKKGLPCGLCGLPTKSTLSHISECQHCKHEKEELYPNEKTSEDPMYCDYCNP